MSVAVITIAHDRDAHLARQHAALERSFRAPDCYVVVAMDDPDLETRLAPTRLPRTVVHVPAVDGHLPLAHARNVGAQTAMSRGATTLIFLDVDCLPSPTLVGAYAETVEHGVTSRDLLCGPVTYLPPPPPGGYALDTLDELSDPHPARPTPSAGEVRRTREAYELFWSLSFALGSDTWYDIGGFDEAYVGYGAEDTDFARRAERGGTALTWVGDAPAYHQHHPVSSPPIEHVDDIVRNATIFHERWGDWPMKGWLAAFAELGLVECRSGRIVATPGRSLTAGSDGR